MESAQGDISGIFMTPSQESAQSEAGWPGRSSGFQNGTPPKAKRLGGPDVRPGFKTVPHLKRSDRWVVAAKGRPTCATK